MAIVALGQLGGANEGKRIAECLEDEDPLVRATAAQRLGILGITEFTSKVAKRLEDRDQDVKIEALHALARLEARDLLSRLESFLTDPKPKLRNAAAAALCALGSRSAVEGVLREPVTADGLNSLNAIRQPDAWVKLKNAPVSQRMNGARMDILRRLANQAGFSIEFGSSVRKDWAMVQGDAFVTTRSGHGKVLEALEDLMLGRYVFILDGGTIRVQEYAEGKRLWEEWWDREKPKK